MQIIMSIVLIIMTIAIVGAIVLLPFILYLEMVKEKDSFIKRESKLGDENDSKTN